MSQATTLRQRPPLGPEEPLPPVGRILQTIEETPGLSIEEVADRVALSRSTVRYHIDRLSSDRLVVIQRQGNHRLHFPASMPRMRCRALTLLRLGSIRSVVDAVMQPVGTSDPPGPTTRFRTATIADETGVGVRSVYRCVRTLERAGLAEMTPTGTRGSYFMAVHPELRIAWVFYAKDAARAPRPLRAAPAWLLVFEMLLGKMAVGAAAS